MRNMKICLLIVIFSLAKNCCSMRLETRLQNEKYAKLELLFIQYINKALQGDTAYLKNFFKMTNNQFLNKQSCKYLCESVRYNIKKLQVVSAWYADNDYSSAVIKETAEILAEHLKKIKIGDENV